MSEYREPDWDDINNLIAETADNAPPSGFELPYDDDDLCPDCGEPDDFCVCCEAEDEWKAWN